MPAEPLSPELALVDPELGARARAVLPDHAPAPWRPQPGTLAAPIAAPQAREAVRQRPYPVWARMTAALWLVVIGILIGGTAIPHAQDRPRVVPPAEDVTICEPRTAPSTPPGLNNPLGP